MKWADGVDAHIYFTGFQKNKFEFICEISVSLVTSFITDQLQKAENTTKEVKEQILELRGESQTLHFYRCHTHIVLNWKIK